MPIKKYQMMHISIRGDVTCRSLDTAIAIMNLAIVKHVQSSRITPLSTFHDFN